MPFTITIVEHKLEAATTTAPSSTEVYRQTVETLDLPAVFSAINRRKRVRRAPVKQQPKE